MIQPKSIEQITAEWQMIEATRPGGSHPDVLTVLQETAGLELPKSEKALLVGLRVLHDSVQQYHVEMGILLSLAAERDALKAALAELVELKALKARLGPGDYLEYRNRQPGAWAQAQAVLGRGGQG